MEMSGEQLVPAPQQAEWNALNFNYALVRTKAKAMAAKIAS